MLSKSPEDKEALKSTMTDMLAAWAESSKKNAAEALDQVKDNKLVKKLQAQVDGGSPEGFSWVTKDFEEVKEAMVEQVVHESMDVRNRGLAVFLFTEYDYVSNMFTETIKRFEGLACCADRSGFVIGRLAKYFLKAEPVPENKDGDKAFWRSKVFHDLDSMVLGLYAFKRLYYGKPLTYLEFLTLNQSVHDARIDKKKQEESGADKEV